MYGYFRLPNNTKKEEKLIFRNCMCNLCNSLHREYGIRARIFVNYDSTLLLLIRDLFGSSKLISDKKFKIFPCLKKFAPNTEFQKFVSAITIMLAYCRKYDNIIDIDEDPSMSHWFSNYVDMASSFLKPYGLSKSFFESLIIIQHNSEALSNDLETLSLPTQEILGKIFFNLSHLIEQGENRREWELFGRDIGFLIYIYDGISDFYYDIEKGNFNCINSQFNSNIHSLNELNKDIELIIERKKSEINTRLITLGNGNNLNLLKKNSVEFPIFYQ